MPVLLCHYLQKVSNEVDLAELPGSILKQMLHRLYDASVVIGNGHLHSMKPSGLQFVEISESHPIISLHLRCGDSEVGSRGTVIASEHSERAFEPGGMQLTVSSRQQKEGICPTSF